MTVGRLVAGAGCAAVLAAACVSAGPPGAPAASAGQPVAAAPTVPAQPREAASGVTGPDVASAPAAREADGLLAAYLAGLRDASCPQGVRTEAAEEVEMTVKPVPLQGLNPLRRKVGELTFVAGFHLTSPDKRFGGLSGIDILDDGNLLAVSDQGDFVWVDLARDGVTPAAARIASMRDSTGEPLRGKADGDAEGLAFNQGMALVAFERNHRVLAFDLSGCGAGVRGVPIASGGHGAGLPAAFERAGIAADANEGPEPLAVTPDWRLFTGVETRVGEASPLSARPIEAAPEFDLRLGEGAAPFVGLDVISSGDRETVRAFSLHRSFSPLSGNAISIIETDFERHFDQSDLARRIASDIYERARYSFRREGARTLAEMNVLFTIDNFEGIAAKDLPDGGVRLYVVSDNNFSTSQRTLLMVFELAG